MPDIAGGERIDCIDARCGDPPLDSAVAPEETIGAEGDPNDATNRFRDPLERGTRGANARRMGQTGLGEDNVRCAPRKIEKRLGRADIAVEDRRNAQCGSRVEQCGATSRPADIRQHSVASSDASERQPRWVRVERRVGERADQSLPLRVDEDRIRR